MFSAFVLFTYISASSFILQDIYKLSSLMFSLCFAVNAIAIATGCATAGHLQKKKSIKYGAIIMFCAALSSIVTLNTVHSVILTEVTFIVLMFAFGLLQPIPTAIALDSERNNAGVASAALGASGFLAGGIVAPIVGMGNMLQTTTILFLAGSLFVGIFAFLSFRICKK